MISLTSMFASGSRHLKINKNKKKKVYSRNWALVLEANWTRFFIAGFEIIYGLYLDFISPFMARTKWDI